MRVLRKLIEAVRRSPAAAFAVLLLGATVLWAGSQYASPPAAPAEAGPKPREVDFSEFRALVDAGKLAEATVGQTKVEARTKDGEKVVIVHDGWLYRYDLPKELSEKGVKVGFPEKPKPGVGDQIASVFGMLMSTMFVLVFGFVGWVMWMQLRNLVTPGWPKVVKAHTVETRFADVAGQQEPKFELEEIKAFLKAPHEYARLGARAPRGVLMVGPPGTGKTLIAKALAGEAGAAFIAVSGSDFSASFIGVGAQRMKKLFALARKKAPCIVFIDEIDAVARRRGASGSDLSRESDTTLNTMLTEMDGFAAAAGVIVIGATNRVDVLDPAATRPGRFDRHVHVGLPDLAGRREILDVHSRGRPLAADVDMRVVARGTPGFSGADLQNLVNEASVLAAREAAEAVSARHFELARDKAVMGLQRKGMALDDHELDLVAWHEAGHAVAATLLPDSDEVHAATIVPRGASLGLVMRLPDRDRVSVPRARLEADLVVMMAGRAAEEIKFGADRVTTGAASDIEQATSIARRMVTEWGMSPLVGMVRVQDRQAGSDPQVDAEVRRIVDESYRRAHELLTASRASLDSVAAALRERESLTGDEVRAAVASAVPALAA